MDIAKLVAAIDAGKINVTSHARVELEADDLTGANLYDSIRRGEIIEDYPDDSPFPSCLIFGRTADGVPVHSVWAWAAEQGIAIVVTAYRPDPSRWIDFKVRRR